MDLYFEKSVIYKDYHKTISDARNKIKKKFIDFFHGYLHNPRVIFDWMKKYNVHLVGHTVSKFLSDQKLNDSENPDLELVFYSFEDLTKYKTLNTTSFFRVFLSYVMDQETKTIQYRDAKTTFKSFLNGQTYFTRINDCVVSCHDILKHGTFAHHFATNPHNSYTPLEKKVEHFLDEAFMVTSFQYKKSKEGNEGEVHIKIIHVKGQILNIKSLLKKFPTKRSRASFDGHKFTVLHPKSYLGSGF